MEIRKNTGEKTWKSERVLARKHGNQKEYWRENMEIRKSTGEKTWKSERVLARKHGNQKEYWWENMEIRKSTGEKTWKSERVLARKHGNQKEYWRENMEIRKSTGKKTWKSERVLARKHGNQKEYWQENMEIRKSTGEKTWKSERVLVRKHGNQKEYWQENMEIRKSTGEKTWKSVGVQMNVVKQQISHFLGSPPGPSFKPKSFELNPLCDVSSSSEHLKKLVLIMLNIFYEILESKCANHTPCNMSTYTGHSPVAMCRRSGGSNFQLGTLDPLFPYPASSSSYQWPCLYHPPHTKFMDLDNSEKSPLKFQWDPQTPGQLRAWQSNSNPW